MANLRRSLTPQQGIDAPARRRHSPVRWLAVGAVMLLGLLALAWADGGETPVRPIAEPVTLPEQPR